MSTITTIQSTDLISNSRADINTNFSNLNTDKVEGQASSVDSEVALFSSTGGKTVKRATGTGIVRVASGVYGTPGNVVESEVTLADNTTNDVTSTKHGLAPKAPADATKFLNGGATPAFALVKDSDLSTSDITTNDVTSAKHGFAPKGDGSTTKFLNANGAYSTPAAGELTVFQAPGTCVTNGTLGFTGAIAQLPCVTLADGSTQYASFNFKVPSGATSISSIKVFHQSVGTGNIFALFYTTHFDTDAQSTATQTDLTDTATAYAGVASGSGIITVPAAAYNALTNIDVDDIISLYIERQGGSGSDTYNNPLDIVGVIVTFA